MDVTRWLTKHFGKPEEIDGGGRCPTYLYRWTLMKLPFGYKVYLHHFVGDDWSLDFHDHPKRFWSIGLWGWYEERTPIEGKYLEEIRKALNESTKRAEAEARRLGIQVDLSLAGALEAWSSKEYHAPWIRTFSADYQHRICTPSGSCWTLVIVGKPSREWGFWHRFHANDEALFIPWKAYVQERGGPADKQTACK